MRTTMLLLLFLLSFSMLSAVFIDYDRGDTMNDMYEYAQGSTVYYIDQPVRYYLETDLYLPFSARDLWLSGNGSYSDIHSGDSVCEGQFKYRLRVHAYARNSVSGKIPSVSGTSEDPGDWPDCTGSCPEGNRYVLWSTSTYNAHLGDYGDVGRQISPTSVYGWRGIRIRESGTGPFDSNERVDMAVVMKGSTRLRKGGATVVGPNTLSGTSYSHSPSSTIGIYTSSYTQYSFTQRVNVNGGLVAVFAPEGYPPSGEETYWAYQDLGNSQNDYYTETVTSPASTLNVYDENHVGIIPPYIFSVDPGSDGGPDPSPYQVTAGQDLPVTLTMVIPARPSKYYALPFEFYDVNVNAPPGTTFAETSGINQCSSSFYFARHINGGWFPPYDAYYSSIQGTLHIPATLGPGVYQVPFSVDWRSCSGAEDCNGNGVTGTTPEIIIEIEIPDEIPDPDLTCTIEPIAYIDGIAPAPDGFYIGQGVETWRVTVTNIGAGNATINTLDEQICSMLIFNADNSDGTKVFDPYHSEVLVGSLPGTIVSGGSVTFDIDGDTLCSDTGDEVSAFAWTNIASFWFPACTPHFISETDYTNNMCEWAAPCGEAPGPGECTIVPHSVHNPPSEYEQPFDLFCEGNPCTGAVIWDTTTTGDSVGTMTSSGQAGAVVTIIEYDITEDDISGNMLLEATVATPENMICNATIEINTEGPGGDDDYCYCEETPQIGHPGSYHEFELFCVEDGGDPEHCSGTWAIIDGSEHVSDHSTATAWWYWLTISNDLLLTDEGNVLIRADVEGLQCYCEVILPPMDCYDFI